MGKTSGCVLILAGLAVAAYALYPESQPEADAAAAQSAPVVGGSTAGESPATTTVAAGDTAAHQTLLPFDSGKRDRGGQRMLPPTLFLPPAPLPAPLPARRPPPAVAVAIDQAPPRVPVGESRTLEPAPDGAALTREIQRHLKRVGCYQGEVTGIWSPAVRQAMRDFTERANARLPVSQPDPVLLAIVASQAPGVCGPECPKGQDRAANGRCVPSALVAAKSGAKQTAKAGSSAGSDRKISARDPVAVGGPPPDASASAAAASGKAAVAGPQARRPSVAAGRQPSVAGWSARAAPQPRPRVRRAHQPAPYKGYSGLPSWLPFSF